MCHWTKKTEPEPESKIVFAEWVQYPYAQWNEGRFVRHRNKQMEVNFSDMSSKDVKLIFG